MQSDRSTRCARETAANAERYRYLIFIWYFCGHPWNYKFLLKRYAVPAVALWASTFAIASVDRSVFALTCYAVTSRRGKQGLTKELLAPEDIWPDSTFSKPLDIKKKFLIFRFWIYDLVIQTKRQPWHEFKTPLFWLRGGVFIITK